MAKRNIGAADFALLLEEMEPKFVGLHLMNREELLRLRLEALASLRRVRLLYRSILMLLAASNRGA